MKILLIRHATRERDPGDEQGRELPLNKVGCDEARQIGIKLRELRLTPRLYLSSRYRHATQTAEVIRDTIAEQPPAPVVPVATLTPKEPYDFPAIIQESLAKGHDLSELQIVAFVLHHPRLNQLLEVFTSQPASLVPPPFSTTVCVTGDSLDAFIRGRAKEDFRI